MIYKLLSLYLVAAENNDFLFKEHQNLLTHCIVHVSIVPQSVIYLKMLCNILSVFFWRIIRNFLPFGFCQNSKDSINQVTVCRLRGFVSPRMLSLLLPSSAVNSYLHYIIYTYNIHTYIHIYIQIYQLMS